MIPSRPGVLVRDMELGALYGMGDVVHPEIHHNVHLQKRTERQKHDQHQEIQQLEKHLLQ